MPLNRRHAALAVLAWVVVFGAFAVLTGPTEFVDAATSISGPRLGVMMGLNLLGTLTMGLVLYTVGQKSGLGISPVESVFLNATVSLASNLKQSIRPRRCSLVGQAVARGSGGVQISACETDHALAACENRRFSGGRKTASSGKLKGRGRVTVAERPLFDATTSVEYVARAAERREAAERVNGRTATVSEARPARRPRAFSFQFPPSPLI